MLLFMETGKSGCRAGRVDFWNDDFDFIIQIFFIFADIFSLLILSGTKSLVKSSTIHYDFIYFSFYFCQFLICAFGG